MKKTKFLLFIVLSLFIFSCSKKEKDIVIIQETSQELEMISTYKDGYQALSQGDPYFAAKKFLEAEMLYPQSLWAPRSVLMASYSYYFQNYYAEAISNLERYLKTYPNDKNIVYAHYLLAMCYYESIIDEKRDTRAIIKAREKFEYVIKEFPSTEFALDSSFKLNLIKDILASKEMYIGRHYIKKGKWIASINRFKTVVDEYDQTIFIEEALHRLVEVYFTIGLSEEAEKYAKVLGYNYLSSEWYKKSYSFFHQDYYPDLKKKITREKKGVFDKFKMLF
jgi:outer membrane protein assembly factor BamD